MQWYPEKDARDVPENMHPIGLRSMFLVRIGIGLHITISQEILNKKLKVSGRISPALSTTTESGLDKEDYMKELVMTKYLEGLKELFDKYGVTQAYSYEPFANTKEDGVVIWAKVGREGENALMEYMDNYINNEEKAWPELRSFCIGIEVPTKRMHLIYENGRFYE